MNVGWTVKWFDYDDVRGLISCAFQISFASTVYLQSLCYRWRGLSASSSYCNWLFIKLVYAMHTRRAYITILSTTVMFNEFNSLVVAVRLLVGWKHSITFNLWLHIARFYSLWSCPVSTELISNIILFIFCFFPKFPMNIHSNKTC